MGFSPKLIFADICLILSIAIAWYIQSQNPAENVQIGLIILASIFLAISLIINLVNAHQKKKENQNR
ncbi:hypothetical protein [Lentilactobacillus kribbianus]|uniref:hypothetical protein n=1 Tax=Lentilactobacillus kribbianus TaxID=2729622 RepID=UPI001551A825|nr:hypothetical protein [Lentilactobacillus kribbianus]